MNHLADICLVDTHSKGIGGHDYRRIASHPSLLFLYLDIRTQSCMIIIGSYPMFVQMFCYFGCLNATSQIDNCRTSSIFSAKHTSKITQLVFGINYGICKVWTLEGSLQDF